MIESATKIVLEANQGLFLPSGHPHMVRTTTDSVAVGMNFIMENHIGKQVNCAATNGPF